MLVPAMNPKEVTAEVLRDLATIQYIQAHYCNEYRKERELFKIDATKTYTRIYTTTSQRRNSWLIVIQKSPAAKRYNVAGGISCVPVVYYHDKFGLNALRYLKDTDTFELFLGHLFNRYNERMNLHLNTPLEVMKHFFSHNNVVEYLHWQPTNNLRTAGVCKDGMLFGKATNNGKWLMNKTFVSRKMVNNKVKHSDRLVLDTLKIKKQQESFANTLFTRKEVLQAMRA